ncbi:hypothetical protein [Amphritea sp. HPY]|uniref:hypothetical protein n=1 Tax=Amphritea sp. HPY TaxID=3421652 RepID=UPI003D7DCE5B
MLSAVLFLSLLSVVLTVDETSAEEAAGSNDQVVTLPEFPALSQFEEVMQRPLFNEGRKPQPKSSGPAGGNEQELRETWKLTGITIIGERVMALFQERKGDKRLRLEVGMALDDRWQLEEVNADWVSVISGDQLVRMELRQPRESLPVSPKERKTPVNGAQGSDSTATERKTNPTQKPAARAGKVQEM